MIYDTLEMFDNRMKDAVNENHEGKRKNESNWFVPRRDGKACVKACVACRAPSAIFLYLAKRDRSPLTAKPRLHLAHSGHDRRGVCQVRGVCCARVVEAPPRNGMHRASSISIAGLSGGSLLQAEE